VAIIGCVVNGPGEAKEVAVGLTGGQPNLLYINGEKSHKLSNDELIDEIEFQVRSQIK
jgi:(E)-4-hydroxy-3-methylbut-2-enyl-diphosphate synthase